MRCGAAAPIFITMGGQRSRPCVFFKGYSSEIKIRLARGMVRWTAWWSAAVLRHNLRPVPDPLAAVKMRLQGLGARIRGYPDDGQGAQLSAKPGSAGRTRTRTNGYGRGHDFIGISRLFL
jgi:hypothetical protein